MAMGRNEDEQEELFVAHTVMRNGMGHPFYEALEKVLRVVKFDEHVEGLCAKFYADKAGRPSLAPGVYFRCLLIGFFEGIDSERGIAWRAADSISLRGFLNVPMSKKTPDHSTLSKTRRRIDLNTHGLVFNFVLKIVAEHGLVRGKTIGVDATTLEANAAMRSLVRRDTGQSYNDYLTDLAKASGIETPTREELARFDRKRPKKGSNEDWVNPNEPDAQVMKMKTGGTRMAHKHEHAVDMDTGAIVGMSLNGGAKGDTDTIEETITDADENLQKVRSDANEETVKHMAEQIEEATADKGYHSNKVLLGLDEQEIRSYISEPKRGRRNWKNKRAERDSVYRNRRRLRLRKGKNHLRRRGELLERTMAHLFNTGGMRRIHLRKHNNIKKRLLIHAAGFNLSLIMRAFFGVGKPRCLQGNAALMRALAAALARLFQALLGSRTRSCGAPILGIDPVERCLNFWRIETRDCLSWPTEKILPLSTGC